MRVFLSSIILAQTPPQSFFEVKFYFKNIKNIKFYTANQRVLRRHRNKQ